MARLRQTSVILSPLASSQDGAGCDGDTALDGGPATAAPCRQVDGSLLVAVVAGVTVDSGPGAAAWQQVDGSLPVAAVAGVTVDVVSVLIDTVSVTLTLRDAD